MLDTQFSSCTRIRSEKDGNQHEGSGVYVMTGLGGEVVRDSEGKSLHTRKTRNEKARQEGPALFSLCLRDGIHLVGQ
jgi:hypothetical protein